MAAYPSVPLAPSVDGVMMTIDGNSLTLALYRARAQGVANDFIPVSLAGEAPYWLVINPEVLEVARLADLVATARDQPGQYRFASGGEGWISHLAGEMFKQQAELDIEHVPFPGSQNAVLAVLAGTVDMAFVWPIEVARYVKSGALKVLAVTSGCRAFAHPEVPTMQESGFPGFKARGWYGFVLKPGTPRETIAIMNRAVAKALKTAKTREQLATDGLTIVPTKPAEFARYIHAEVVRWRRVIARMEAPA